MARHTIGTRHVVCIYIYIYICDYGTVRMFDSHSEYSPILIGLKSVHSYGTEYQELIVYW